MTATRSFVDRFRESLAAEGGPSVGDKVVVAFSGGLDSCVLLHLLRFAVPERLDVVVAHYDHAIRGESAADALWVRGLCTAWDVPLRTERSGEAARSEDAAREARYDFLERIRRGVSASAVLVGHHADDQAETVLFRVLRGTGISGLAAIPRSRDPAIFRPLLGFWRTELQVYARRAHLAWREDPSNGELDCARNALRHRLLPDAERLVAPGARRALVRLARLAAEDEAAWEDLLQGILDSLETKELEHGLAFSRDAFSRLHPAVQGRVFRGLLRRLGLTLDETGTRLAVDFSGSGRSGTGIDVGGGVELRRQLERLVLRRPSTTQPDRPLSIPDVGPGSGDALLGGERIPVSWGADDVETRERCERLRVDAGRFPLLVRSREPGDRIRLSGGTKKLKKLFLEARIPSDHRGQIPVVVDAAGVVLWVPGVARAEKTVERGSTSTLRIGIG